MGFVPLTERGRGDDILLGIVEAAASSPACLVATRCLAVQDLTERSSFLLHTMLLLQLNVLLDKRVNTVNHALNKLHLRVTQPVFVRNVISDSSLTSRLSASSSRLDLELLAPLLEHIETFLGVAGQVNVNTRTHTCAQVGGTGVDVAVLGIQHEVSARLFLDAVLYSFDSSGKAVKNATHISTLLHGNNPQLILLVDPGEESFFLIMKDSSSLRPISFHACSDEVFIS